MRLVQHSEELYWVRWYPACPDATWYPGWSPFRSSQDRDENEPAPSLGEVRSLCVEWVSCNFCPPPPGVCEVGDDDVFANGITPEALAMATPATNPCGYAAPRLAELIDASPDQPQYGWWQLVCNPDTGVWTRGPAASCRHRLQEDPVTERNGSIGLPVPGTVVQVLQGCGPGMPWYFVHDELDQLVKVTQDHPSVVLTAGSAYTAVRLTPLLTGMAGSQQVSGGWAEADQVAVIDLAGRASIDRTTPYIARRMGRAGGLTVYAARLDPGTGGSGSDSGPLPCDYPCDRMAGGLAPATWSVQTGSGWTNDTTNGVLYSHLSDKLLSISHRLAACSWITLLGTLGELQWSDLVGQWVLAITGNIGPAGLPVRLDYRYGVPFDPVPMDGCAARVFTLYAGSYTDPTGFVPATLCALPAGGCCPSITGDCGGTIVTACCPGGLPATLHATFAADPGACFCLDGLAIPLTWDGTLWAGTATTSCSGSPTFVIAFECTDGGTNWRLTRSSSDPGCSLTPVNQTTFICEPFQVIFDNPGWGTCCNSSYTITVTE